MPLGSFCKLILFEFFFPSKVNYIEFEKSLQRVRAIGSGGVSELEIKESLLQLSFAKRYAT